MKFTEAFRKLGYSVANPINHWSAASDTGVCLSLWRSEMDWSTLTMDTRVNCGPIEEWPAVGANQRRRDLRLAVDRFDGWVDVVIVDGVPGHGIDRASPWLSQERQGRRWRIGEFDDSTGHFALSAVESQAT